MEQTKLICPICGKLIKEVPAWKHCPHHGGAPVCNAHCYNVCGHLYVTPCPPRAPWEMKQ